MLMLRNPLPHEAELNNDFQYACAVREWLTMRRVRQALEEAMKHVDDYQLGGYHFDHIDISGLMNGLQDLHEQADQVCVLLDRICGDYQERNEL